MQSAGLRTKNKKGRQRKQKSRTTVGNVKQKMDEEQVPIGIDEALVNLDASIKKLTTHSGQRISPPVFSGSLEQDVNEFLTWYKHTATVNHWDDEMLVQYLCIALEGDAKKWYSAQISRGIAHTWLEWEELLKGAFRTQNFQELAHLRLLQRVQLPNESVENFYYDTLQLCARVDPNMSEADKVRHLLRGLQPELMSKIMLMTPTSTSDFLEKIQQISRIGLMMKSNQYIMNIVATPTAEPPNWATQAVTIPTSTPVQPVMARPVPSQIHPVFFQEQQEEPVIAADLQKIHEALRRIEKGIKAVTFKPFPASTTRTTEGAPICRHCGKKGHIQRSCFKLKRQRAEAQQFLRRSNKPDGAEDAQEFPATPGRFSPTPNRRRFRVEPEDRASRHSGSGNGSQRV